MDALRSEVLEAQSQLKYLEEQLGDLDVQKEENQKEINEAQRILDVKKHTTKTEIFKLKGTIIQVLFMQRIYPDSSSGTRYA